jgi:cytochrome c oxidase accessory protein FixG
MVCPYGRWQSVMVNEDTIAVTYDYKRGEPRGRRRHDAGARETGDCVDCKLCVQVCPTGIDIRNGIQLECINCTACMDACDGVMERIGRPRGLIRYSSYRGIEAPFHKLLTLRVMGYAAVLAVLVGVVVYLFSTRSEVQAIILREPGRLYNELADGRLANFYSLKIVNKTFDALPVEIRVERPAGGSITLLGEVGTVPPQEIVEGRFYLALAPETLRPGRNEVEFSVYAAGRLVEKVASGFLAPQDGRLRARSDE